MSGYDFSLDAATGIPLCLDPCIVLCPLGVVTSNDHIRDPDCHARHPSGAFPNALSYIPCRPQALVAVFSDDLETSNISKGSSEVPCPAIDYPSSSSGSLVQSPYNTRLRMAGRRTCLARCQETAVLDDCHSS